MGVVSPAVRRWSSPSRWVVSLAVLGLGASGCGSDGFSEPPDSEGSAGATGVALRRCEAADLPEDEPDADLPAPLAEGLAPTPPMGWNSWNRYHCDVSAKLIEDTADAMVESGLRDVGYEYVNIDDCWAEKDRGDDETAEPTDRFPDGIEGVAEYVHERGLKLGIYSDRGTATCAGRAGSEGYEELDAESYAAWGVDYLKYDNCNATLDIETQYRAMRDALDATGRPIVFSVCAWKFYEWSVGLGQLWRTTTDIRPTWDSVYANLLNTRSLAAYAGPNGWNDPDMLEVGNPSTTGGEPSLTPGEQRAHFSLWAILSAPLIAGNDLVGMTDETREILTNAEVIAIDQDPLGLQGVEVLHQGDLWVWAKPLNQEGARAVVLFNAGEAEQEIRVPFEAIGLRAGCASVRDLWQHQDLGFFEDEYASLVPAHGEVTLRIRGTEPEPPVGEVALGDLTWTYAANGLGPVERDQANGATAPADGEPIVVRGQAYERGLGVSAPSQILYRLGGRCSSFSAEVGVDDSTANLGSVRFQVFADGELLFESDVLTGASEAEPVEVDLEGRSRLKLLVTNAGDGNSWDRAVWADARLRCDE